LIQRKRISMNDDTLPQIPRALTLSSLWRREHAHDLIAHTAPINPLRALVCQLANDFDEAARLALDRDLVCGAKRQATKRQPAPAPCRNAPVRELGVVLNGRCRRHKGAHRYVPPSGAARLRLVGTPPTIRSPSAALSPKSFWRREDALDALAHAVDVAPLRTLVWQLDRDIDDAKASAGLVATHRTAGAARHIIAAHPTTLRKGVPMSEVIAVIAAKDWS